jgi:hypothetical protein
MKWILIAISGLAALVALAAIIGAMLPRNHVASRSLTLRRPPQEIWHVIMQATAASSVPVDLVESDPPRRQVTRVKDTEKNFGGTWTITITPTAGGGTLTITEEGWVGNPIFRFVSRYVMGHHATIDGMLKDVAKRFNEDPVLEGS